MIVERTGEGKAIARTKPGFKKADLNHILKNKLIML